MRNLVGLILCVFIGFIQFSSGNADNFEQEISLGKSAKVLCSFKMIIMNETVDIQKSKITCNKYKKPKKNITVKKRKITSSLGNVFTITMTVRRKGGKATLKEASVQTVCNCIFPFNWKGVEHNSCTAISQDNITTPWCASKVDDSGYLTQGEKCSQSCPGATSPAMYIHPKNNPGSCYCGVPNVPKVKKQHRIVGGKETDVGEYPWQVSLLSGSPAAKVPVCGGVLVSDTYVLTAAHCTRIIQQSGKVVLGDTNYELEDEVQSIIMNILTIKEHPEYDPVSKRNDISIIELEKPVDLMAYPNIKPICLPATGATFPEMTATVTGWGHDKFGGKPNPHLHEVIVTIFEDGNCGQLNGRISPDMICAGVKDKDSCHGDSGGPLFLADPANGNSHTVVGLVSWGDGCAGVDSPGVYAEVSHFRPWLDAEMANMRTCSHTGGLSKGVVTENTCSTSFNTTTDLKIFYFGPAGGGGREVFYPPAPGARARAGVREPSCYIPELPDREIYEKEGEPRNAAAFVLHGTLTTCGGWSGETVPYCHALINFKWRQITSMISPRDGHTVVNLMNDTVLVAGGFYGRGGTALQRSKWDTTEQFDGTDWVRGPDLPVKVTAHCMVYVPEEDMLLLIGGVTTEFRTDTTYAYTQAKGTWTQKSSMKIKRNTHACALLSNEVWVGGGFDGTPDGDGTVEIYSPQSDTWSWGPDLPYAAYIPGEFVLNGQDLYYVGGWEKSDIHVLNNEWRNKEKTNWIHIGNTNHPRFGFPALLITEAECFGVAYDANGIGTIPGSNFEVLYNLTSQTEELEVLCCKQGNLTTPSTSCGNGTSCEGICGDNVKDYANIIISSNIEDNEICSLLDDKTTSIAYRPIYKISYCVYKVFSPEDLLKYPVCCYHPVTHRTIKGVQDRCCKKYNMCY